MTTVTAAVPKHVPSDRILDFDFFNVPAPGGDLHEGWHRLHAAPQLFWTPRNGGHWVATRGALIKEAYAEYTRFSSRCESIPADTQLPLMPPVTLDPPAHAAYRNLIAPKFAPKAIAALSDRVRELTISLIEKFRNRGECEFVSEFALQMPVGVFLGLVDLPLEDRPLLLRFAEVLTRAGNAQEVEQAFDGVATYLAAKLEQRKRHPGEDLLSLIANSRPDGEPISDQALLGTCTVILSAGLDTVASTLGFVTRFLASSPQHRRQLIEHPEVIPTAVEELLRRFGVANLARVVSHDMHWHGVEMKAGDMILLSAPLGNLDEQMFQDPLAVDFTRRDAGNNVSFGAGPHRCVGSFLARNELRIFLEEWLARIPDFEIKPGEQVRVKSGKVNSVQYLPLIWKS